ncbi:MAG: GTP cyclohydrolase [Spirochaetes bacterium DG_61]|jgi:GTP cyclohydrolase I|nr:MAG: GTP cyclohydrolase [Spirochaetes bacterium DG_61]
MHYCIQIIHHLTEAAVDKEKIKNAIRMIIEEVDPSPARPDLERTPERVANMFEEIFSGAFENPEDVLKVMLTEQHDEIVLVKDIPIYSMCEHHMLPFFGHAHVAYIPKDNRITGLSKLARVVDVYAKRLQVQERLTTSIADLLMKKLMPYGVIVVIEAEHLCMIMRGVKKPSSYTVTSAVRGIFKENEKTRAEALSLILAARPFKY